MCVSGCAQPGKTRDYLTLPPGPFRSVYLVPDSQAGFDRLELIVQAGEMDNTGPEGLAHYTEHLAWISQIGTGRLSSRHSNAWTTDRATGYFVSGPGSDLPSNMRRLLGVHLPFDLPEKFMLEERDIVLREFDQRMLEWPYASVYRDIGRILYGDGPLSRTTIGTAKSISTFTVEAAREFHQRTHAHSNSVLIASGSLKPEALQSELQQRKANELSKPVPIPAPPVAPIRDEQMVELPRLSAEELVYAKIVDVTLYSSGARLQVTVDMLGQLLDSALEGGIAGPLRYDAFIARSFDLGLSLNAGTHLEMWFSARPDSGVSLDTLQQAFELALQSSSEAGIPEQSFNKVKQRYLADVTNTDDKPEFTRRVLRQQIMNRLPPLGYSDILNAAQTVTLGDVEQLYRALIGDGRLVIRQLYPRL